MCLYVDKFKTKSIKERAERGDGWIKVWKMFDHYRHNKFLSSYYQNSKWRLGTNEIRMQGELRKTIHPVNIDDVVREGIHAYTMKSTIIQKYYAIVVVKCWGHVDDLIAVGTKNDIAFTRVYIDKEHYKKLLNKLYPGGGWSC